MDGDSQIDKIIGVIIAAMIGLILIVRAFLPIAADQIADIADIDNINELGGAGTITGLLSVVVTIVIIALVISIIKMLRDRD